MSLRRIIPGTVAMLLLAACSGSPSAPNPRDAEIDRPVTDAAPVDSTQAADRGHMFGSGT
jgi:hypothetical protein